MRTYAPASLLLLACLVISGCQTYTKGLQDSVVAADETAAMSAIRTVAGAEQTYSTSNNGSYGTFAQLVKAGFLDSRFDSDKPKFKGYILSLVVSDRGGEPSFTLNADPEPPQQGRHFYVESSSSLIHVNPSQPAGVSDPTIG
jgi:hypothetical protein